MFTGIRQSRDLELKLPYSYRVEHQIIRHVIMAIYSWLTGQGSSII